MARTRPEKIEGITEQIEQLIQKQKEQDRKDRTKRLCKRAGLLESLLPDTISLTDEQFKSFLEKTLLNDFTRRTPPQPRQDPQERRGRAVGSGSSRTGTTAQG